MGSVQRIKGVVVFLAVWVVFLLAGCGTGAEQTVSGVVGCGTEAERTVPEAARSGTEKEQTVQEAGSREAVQNQVKFEAVPYFKKEFGSNTQLADGYLYSYWSRRLCRYDLDTLEEEVLYEALSPQDGSFCVADGYIYFLEKPEITFLGAVTGTLYRMRCDGSELTELVTGLILSDGDGYGSYYYYDLWVYDDILYLLPKGYGIDKARFFRLHEDKSIEPLGVEDTIYGKLREPYTDAFFYYQECKDFPPLPYCLEYYGYGFVVDDENHLYYYDVESGYAEQISVLAELGEQAYNGYYLTNDRILYRDVNAVWYAVSLGDDTKLRTIGTLDCYSFSFWDEKGIYYVKREDDHLTVRRLGWDGGEETLYYWVRNSRLSTSIYGGCYFNLCYSDGEYLYYDGMDAGDGVIYRMPLEKDRSDEEPQLVAVYYDSPVKDISIRDTVYTTYQVNETGDKGEFSITSVYLTEETEGARKINAWLEDIYAEEREYIEGWKQDVRKEAFSGNRKWSNTLIDVSYSTVIDYLDENYIGFCVSWYQYYNGAAHGNYGETHYVFDRKLGKRLDITDVVKDTPEETCKIIVPYVESVAEWGTDSEGWEKTILEQGRFYLTQEGIGIHFDVYEITCYASGSQDIIVPYEEFQMREETD